MRFQGRTIRTQELTPDSVNVACQQLGFDGGEKTQLAVRSPAAAIRLKLAALVTINSYMTIHGMLCM